MCVCVCVCACVRASVCVFSHVYSKIMSQSALLTYCRVVYENSLMSMTLGVVRSRSRSGCGFDIFYHLQYNTFFTIQTVKSYISALELNRKL